MGNILLPSTATSLRDRVSWFSPQSTLRVPMIKVIDAIQDYPGEVQILGSALALYALCKGTGVDYIEVMQMIERMERDIDSPYSNQFKAMMAYAKGELNG